MTSDQNEWRREQIDALHKRMEESQQFCARMRAETIKELDRKDWFPTAVFFQSVVFGIFIGLLIGLEVHNFYPRY